MKALFWLAAGLLLLAVGAFGLVFWAIYRATRHTDSLGGEGR